MVLAACVHDTNENASKQVLSLQNYAIHKGAYDVAWRHVDYAICIVYARIDCAHFQRCGKSETRQSIVIARLQSVNSLLNYVFNFISWTTCASNSSFRVAENSILKLTNNFDFVVISNPMTHANYALKLVSLCSFMTTDSPDTENYSLNSVQFTTLWSGSVTAAVAAAAAVVFRTITRGQEWT